MEPSGGFHGTLLHSANLIVGAVLIILVVVNVGLFIVVSVVLLLFVADGAELLKVAAVEVEALLLPLFLL